MVSHSSIPSTAGAQETPACLRWFTKPDIWPHLFLHDVEPAEGQSPIWDPGRQLH